MSAERSKVSVLQTCVGKGQKLTALIEYADDSIVSKAVLDKPAGAITVFAFDKGQKLSEHTVPYDAVVQILDGQARLTIGGQDVEVVVGQVIIMPANVPHAVYADRKFKMLLTMIRA
jgi:quercetin dioxygenase-like cupin family protein